MSGMFKFAFKDGDNIIGKKMGGSNPDVVLSGVGIDKIHTKINYNSDERTCIISPNAEDNKKYRVMVNGEILEAP